MTTLRRAPLPRHPVLGRRIAGAVALAVVLCLSGGIATAASAVFRRVERRPLPTGWTQPELTRSPATGRLTYKPSIPEDFEEREMGGLLDVRAVTVHVNSVHGRIPRAGPQLRLIGRNGQGVVVKAGIWTPVNGRFLRVIVEDGRYILESMSPRRRWRMMRVRQ
ncbi:MAG: hypothetical protein HN742_37715 [Lentisphaerae bacterium]|nr:hypothetical protein [Lentisphaerota bacterium]MBT5608155.1 hypothetical protein [Lentisphaerota bacterium]MBT7058703.1 hypothetical protein [Lentisphaerota bacterium]MBT7847667.1 hypothetical protein [Lentisphaerota bacterium]